MPPPFRPRRHRAKDEGPPPDGGRRPKIPSRLPETLVVQITGTDTEGDAIARPADWAGNGPPPPIVMAPEPRGRPALAPGERVLARLKPIGRGRYEGRTIRRIDAAPGKVLGVFRPAPAPPLAAARTMRAAPRRLLPAHAGGGRIQPTDRRSRAEWLVPPGQDGGAQEGEIVLAEPLPHDGLGLKPARVIERLGRLGDARSVSLIAIVTNGIPQDFSAEALAQARAARGLALGTREDLRDIPLITIDGEDARDFDDAVYAEPIGTGFRLIVAIADVAHYVAPGSALDRAARERGNSCYFPDRVVPMLPEELSNGWCSLRPAEERGCLFVEMFVGPDGKKTRHRFGRGLMRSAARLTYEQVQRAEDELDHHFLPWTLPPGLLATLYGAFRALLAARVARGTLDLDLPERKVVLDAHGHVLQVAPRPRLDSHRLIEEFMVLANVAAAEELERHRQPCMYRVHAPPSEEKLEALRAFLHGLGISLPPGNQLHPRDLDRVLRSVAGTDEALLVNEVTLRSQSQAAYAPENIGHFGLGLSRYAHFTSPIRRYADLLVHRALIRGLRLGGDGITDTEAGRMAETGEHITATERRAAMAERDAVDRYLAAYMAEKMGAVFAARISGVTRSALFVTVVDNGANGIVPIGTLPDDFWFHDEREQTLTGRRTGLTFRLAQPVEVRLAEANRVTGGLLFHILQGAPDTVRARPAAASPAKAAKRPRAPARRKR
ncbi:MAG: VacB/RNase II family 3'-5' exoribonuclease [Proteobacteria bacterium]|nr:VacB/RNase II family 3'-5' exoribonuclease [Pseudomonadota bacterium]